MKRFIQITSGKGPEECCYAVAQVLKKILKECKAANCYFEVVQRETSGINGNLHSATLWIDTKNHPSILIDWLGTIQWVSQSPFRVHHKRKNWFIGVFEIPETSIGTFQLSDVRHEAIRSSGPGGQHVNKVSSAIRAVHIPSSLAIKVMDTRSQLQNKRLANERLERLWNQQQIDKVKEAQEQHWMNHMTLERGNPTKIFVSSDFKQKRTIKKFRDQRKTEKQNWQRNA